METAVYHIKWSNDASPTDELNETSLARADYLKQEVIFSIYQRRAGPLCLEWSLRDAAALLATTCSFQHHKTQILSGSGLYYNAEYPYMLVFICPILGGMNDKHKCESDLDHFLSSETARRPSRPLMACRLSSVCTRRFNFLCFPR